MPFRACRSLGLRALSAEPLGDLVKDSQDGVERGGRLGARQSRSDDATDGSVVAKVSDLGAVGVASMARPGRSASPSPAATSAAPARVSSISKAIRGSKPASRQAATSICR
jgi:hypothetical protein